jgi:hypothetical protein
MGAMLEEGEEGEEGDCFLLLDSGWVTLECSAQVDPRWPRSGDAAAEPAQDRTARPPGAGLPVGLPGITHDTHTCTHRTHTHTYTHTHIHTHNTHTHIHTHRTHQYRHIQHKHTHHTVHICTQLGIHRDTYMIHTCI